MVDVSRHPEQHPDDLPPSELRPSRRLPRGLLWAAALASVVLLVALVALGGEDDVATLDSSVTPPADLAPRTASDATGAPLPEVTFETFDGGTASLSDHRGRPLVINFWAASCVPCIQEMPAFEEVHRELGDEVAFLGLNVREGIEAAERMVERTGVTYDLGRDPSGAIIQSLGGINLPTTVVADAEGTVVEVHVGALDADELRDLIEAAA